MPATEQFEAFVTARSRRLLRTAYLLTHDHALAEDLVQTALAKSWFAWSRIEGDPEPYVRKVLVNTYSSWWRRRWTGEHPTEQLPETGVDEPADRTDLWAALERLPRRQRAVIVLRYFEDLTEAETARLLDCTVGTVLAATAAVAALAIGVMPSLTATPGPADTPKPPPSDVSLGAITFPGVVDGQPLQAARIGPTGAPTVRFDWVPDKPPVVIRTVCSARADLRLRMTIDSIQVAEDGCTPGASQPVGDINLPAGSPVWSTLRSGERARVEVMLVDDGGRPAQDKDAIVAAAVYRSAEPTMDDPMPSRRPPTSPDDYVERDVRYRATVGGDTLVGAVVAGAGRDTVELTFTPPSGKLSVRPVCIGNDGLEYTGTLNGVPLIEGACVDGGNDAGALGGYSGDPLSGLKAGQPNVLRMRLTDRDGKTVSIPPTVRMGVGVYRIGAQQIVRAGGETLEFDKVLEYNGHRYRFADVRTAAATSGSVRTPTPAGVPLVLVWGSTKTGSARVTLFLGGIVDSQETNQQGGRLESVQPSRAAGTATLRITAGKAEKGTLYIAVYTPIR